MKEQQDRRRCNGGTVGAAVGVVPLAERGGSAFGGAALVNGRTFMAAAVISEGEAGDGPGGSSGDEGGCGMSAEALVTTPVAARRRVDREGQARMSSRSLLLLVRMAVGDGKDLGWNTTLKSFKIVFGISERDLQPLVVAGWVGERVARTGGKVIWITDEGNALVRGLVEWMEFQAEGGAV